MKKKPYAEITVADIIRDCGMSRNTFYYHFMDKQDLMYWIYLDTRAQAIKVTSVDTVDDNLARLTALMQKDAEIYSQVRHDVDQNGFRECYFEANYQCYKKLFRSYLGERKIDPQAEEYLLRYATHGGSEMLFDLLEGKLNMDMETYLKIGIATRAKMLYPMLDYFCELEEQKAKNEEK